MRFIVSLAFCLGMINLPTVLSDDTNDMTTGSGIPTRVTTELQSTTQSSYSTDHRSPSTNTSTSEGLSNTVVSTTNSTDQEQTTISDGGSTGTAYQETTAENEGTSFVLTSPSTHCDCSVFMVTTEIVNISSKKGGSTVDAWTEDTSSIEGIFTISTTQHPGTTGNNNDGGTTQTPETESTPAIARVSTNLTTQNQGTPGNNNDSSTAQIPKNESTSATAGISNNSMTQNLGGTGENNGSSNAETTITDSTSTIASISTTSGIQNEGGVDKRSKNLNGKRKALNLQPLRAKREVGRANTTSGVKVNVTSGSNGIENSTTTSNAPSDDGTGSYTTGGDEYCRLYCLNVTTTSTSATPQTSTATPATTTSKYPKQKPKWDKLKYNVTLEIEVSGTFNESLKDNSSDEYKKCASAFKSVLETKYNSTPGFLDIKILGFRNGSVIAEYEVQLDLEKADTGIENIDTVMKDIAKNWTNAHIPGVGDVDANATIQLQTERLATEFVGCKFSAEICPQAEYTCKGEKFGVEQCIYNCEYLGSPCKNNGLCYAQFNGNLTCHCVESDTQVFYGEFCEHNEPKIRPTKVKKEKNVVLYIVSGVGGGVVLILLLILACVCNKWRKDKKTLPEDVFDGASNLSIENYKIENIPVQGFGRDNPTFADERNSVRMQSISSRYDQDRRGDSRGKMNPIFHDDASDMRTGSGNEYTSMPDDHYYKSLDHDKSDKPAMMYQPSNIRKPIQRDSNTSTGDHMTVNPLPLDAADDMDSRMSFYDRLDTKQEYKIKRPNIRSKAVEY